MASDTDRCIKLEPLERLQPGKELLHFRRQDLFAHRLVGGGQRLVSRGRARAFVHCDRAVMIALHQPIGGKSLHGPFHAFDGLRTIVDQVAEAKDLVNVRFWAASTAAWERRPVAVKCRTEAGFS